MLFIYGRTIELVNFVSLKENKSPALGSGPWAELKEKWKPEELSALICSVFLAVLLSHCSGK